MNMMVIESTLRRFATLANSHFYPHRPQLALCTLIALVGCDVEHHHIYPHAGSETEQDAQHEHAHEPTPLAAHEDPIPTELLHDSEIHTLESAVTCPPAVSAYPVAGPHNGGWDINALTYSCHPHPATAKDNSDFHADHKGHDIFAAKGTPVVSSSDGKVAFVGWDSKGGNAVRIIGSCGWHFYYAHLDSFSPGLSAGMTVQAGASLGTVGNTGNASKTSPHLHFSIFPHGIYNDGIDPFPVLEAVDHTACGGTCTVKCSSGECAGSLPAAGSPFQVAGTAAVYVQQGNTKHHIKDETCYSALGFTALADVPCVSSTVADTLGDAPSVCADGSFVKAKGNSTVYRMEGGLARPLCGPWSPATFQAAFGVSFSAVYDAPPAYISKLTLGAGLYPAGTKAPACGQPGYECGIFPDPEKICVGTLNCGACVCEGPSEQSCGMCGKQSRVCGQDGLWGIWSTCGGQGTCAPGDKQTCPSGTTTTCTAQCTWQPCPSSPEPAQPNNLITNGQFNSTGDSFTDWAGWYQWKLESLPANTLICVYDTVQGQPSSPSVRCEHSTPLSEVWHTQFSHSELPISQGKVYTAKYCIRGGAQGQNVRVVLQDTYSGQQLGLHDQVALIQGQWSCQSTTFTATASIINAKLTFWLGEATQGPVWIDNVSLSP